MRAVFVFTVALSLTLGCGDRPADGPPPAEPTPAPAEPTPDAPGAPGEAEAPETPDAPEAADTPEAPETPPAEPPERTAAPGFMPTPPAFDALPLTARLPADAPGVIATGNPLDLARRIGWAATLDALGPRLARDRAELKQLLGHDLADPAAWRALGVDPTGPAGFAMLSIDPPIAAIAVTLADKQTLRTVLLALAAGVFELSHADEGGLSLLWDARLAIGMTEKEAWLVLGDRLKPGEALHHARALAKTPPQRMIERPDAAPAIARLNYGREVAAFVNLPAIIDGVMREALATAPTRRFERALLGAKALGDAEAIARAGRALEQAREEAALQGPGMLALGVMLRSYLTPFGGLAVGLNVEPAGFQVRVEHQLDLASPVGSVFVSRTGPLALRDAFPRPPTALVEANVDLPAAWELLRAVGAAAGGGRELSMFDGAAREHFGQDVAGLAALCAGDLGWAVEVDPERVIGSRTVDELIARVRFAGHVGLKDADGAAAAIDALSKSPHAQVVPVAEAPKDARLWRMAVDATTTLWMGIARSQLYLSLDEETLRRLLAGSTGDGFVAGLKPTPRAMLDGSDGGWSGWLDIAGLAPIMLDHRPRVTEGPPPGDSKAAAIRAQIAAVDAEIERLREAHRAAEQVRGRALLSAFGHAAASVERVPGGLSGRGGLYPGASDPAALVVSVATEVHTTHEAGMTLWKETLDPLYARRRALTAELTALEQPGAKKPEAPAKPDTPDPTSP